MSSKPDCLYSRLAINHCPFISFIVPLFNHLEHTLAVTISVDGLHEKTIVLDSNERNLNVGLVDPLLLQGLDARFCLDFHWQDDAGRRLGDARDAVLITHFVVDDQVVSTGW